MGMNMQMKIIRGETEEECAEKFNEWSNGTQYITSNEFVYPPSDSQARPMLQVVYGIMGETPQPRPSINRNRPARAR